MSLNLMSWVQQVHNAAVVARSLGCRCAAGRSESESSGWRGKARERLRTQSSYSVLAQRCGRGGCGTWWRRRGGDDGRHVGCRRRLLRVKVNLPATSHSINNITSKANKELFHAQGNKLARPPELFPDISLDLIARSKFT